jgi:type IV secretion system protein VirD4
MKERILKMHLMRGMEVDAAPEVTGRNLNILVTGASGCGKTTMVASPNIESAQGSYLISDPKGVLYKKYAVHLMKQGYFVQKVDFTNPGLSGHYNPFQFVKNEADIVKLAHLFASVDGVSRTDPFWDSAAEILFTAVIAYMMEYYDLPERTIGTFFDLLTECNPSPDRGPSPFSKRVIALEKVQPDSFAARQYKKIANLPDKTLGSLLGVAQSRLGSIDCDQVRQMCSELGMAFATMGQKKCALFVVVSDTDRSMDKLAGIFFSQALSELTTYADQVCGGRLPVDVRLILDDFATNVTIDEFPRMISSMRSRGISAMLLIQSEKQLEQVYGKDAATIMANCDTYIYMGGNDVETAQSIALRCDKSLSEILSLPIGSAWVFQRGETPKLVEAGKEKDKDDDELPEVRNVQEVYKKKEVLGFVART